MKDIKELALQEARKMNWRMDEMTLETFATRLIAAYLKEQEPVGTVDELFDEEVIKRGNWVHNALIYTAPHLPAIPDHLCLVPRNPTDKWVEQVIRFYQPHLDHNCLAWRKCEKHARHWHKAMIAAGEVKP